MVLIGDRERDASSRENFPRACSLLLPASLQIDFVFKALQEKSRSLRAWAAVYSKGETMRKNVIRLLVAVALVVSGSLMPVYAANNPFPTPPLPPVSCN
jgi:hypothetical protein